MRPIALAALVLTLASSLSTLPVAAAGGRADASTPVEDPASLAVWRLDRAVARWQRRCSAAQEELGVAAPDLERDVQRLLGALRALESHASRLANRQLPAVDVRSLRRKLAILRSKLTAVEAFARRPDALRCGPRYRPASARPRVVDPAADCREAVAIGEETVAWQLQAAPGVEWNAPVAGDGWLRFEASVDGRWGAHTGGSPADTEIAVFASCAAGAEPLAANDDMLGLQSAVAFTARAGEGRWLRVRQRVGTAHDPVLLTLGGADGGISGVVTESSSGFPIPDIDVEIRERATGGYVAGANTDENGAYTVPGLASGIYVTRTEHSDGHLDELWDDRPCHDGCDVTVGDPIPVLEGQITSGIDFALLRAGAISGRLHVVETGEAVPDYRVEVYDADGNYVGDVETDGAGRYTAGGLGPGTHFVSTDGSAYRDEVYDDIPCLPYCQPEDGTPVEVVAEETTAAIDFDLHALGSVAGRVTEAATGAPIPFVGLQVYDSLGDGVGWAETDALGYYTKGGLEAGPHFVATSAYAGYRNEVYDDVPCSGQGGGDCEPLSGTPVPVSLGETTPGIDFALDRLGAVTGTVTDDLSGDPVPFLDVALWLGWNEGAGYAAANALGIYVVEDLAAGSYFATTDNDAGYLDELYDDLPCDGGTGGCDPADGTPIAVVLDEVTGGVDFALTRGGVVTGALTDAFTGDPLEFRNVDLWNAAGVHAGDAYTNAAGAYFVDALPDGTYFATTQTAGDYVDELYDDLPCPGGAPGGCDPTTGTPIAVSAGATTAGVDLALELRGGLSGLVTASSGDPLPGIGIDVWDDAGNHLASTATDAGGAYQVDLSSGSFFVSTDSGGGYLDELWDDVPCPDGPPILGLCDPLGGTPVPVIGADPAVRGIDFELAIPLFADGFESGDTSAWSATVP